MISKSTLDASMEAVDQYLTWDELYNTKLYKLWYSHRTDLDLKHITCNVELLRIGNMKNVPNSIKKTFNITRHDSQLPYKIYQYLGLSLKRLLK